MIFFGRTWNFFIHNKTCFLVENHYSAYFLSFGRSYEKKKKIRPTRRHKLQPNARYYADVAQGAWLVAFGA